MDSLDVARRGENALASLVGHRVVIRGMLKHARHDTGPVGTSGTFTPGPTNGGPSPGSDLKLREIDVESFTLVPVMTAARNEPVVAPAAPEPVAVEPLPQAPPAAAPSLPKTASPLPAIGLLGLLSLAAAMGLRMFDPRRSALS